MAKRRAGRTAAPRSLPLPDADWRRRFRRRLVAWYRRHARDLPWRRSRDPYAVWVSEIMLQQTQVATVESYFRRFLERFPNVEELARSKEQDVLRLWEGLGYYRRARQLHRAAKAIVAEHGGRFPRDADAVRRLPGIGRYTAGAILSIAFDAREPILEANTTRLFCRLTALREPPTTAPVQELLWAIAEAVLPRGNVGAFNQALMELGSEVCTPRAPRCEACPVAVLCLANAEGLQARIPAAKPKPAFESVREAAVVVRRESQVLLRRCAEGERWAGLWDFPRFAVEADTPTALRRELAAKVRRQTGCAVKPGRHLATIKHGVTRFRITLDCYEAQCKHRTNAPVAELARVQTHVPNDGQTLRWVDPGELDAYPLSTTGRKIARLLAHAPGPPGRQQSS